MATHASDTLTRRMTARPPIELFLGDVLTLRRPHPCGGRDWFVDRVGADIGLRCLGCGRHVLIERRTVERRLVAFVSRGDEALTAAVAPREREAEAPPDTTKSTP
jgi:hypothetical protein